jgi:hypothetical protein
MNLSPHYAALFFVAIQIGLSFAAYDNRIGGFFPNKNPIQRQKLSEKWAQNLIDYFDLENYRLNYGEEEPESLANLKSRSEPEKGCNSLDDFKNYFLNVYGHQNDNKFLNNSDLELLIKHQVSNSPKEKDFLKLSNMFKCQRKKV